MFSEKVLIDVIVAIFSVLPQTEWLESPGKYRPIQFLPLPYKTAKALMDLEDYLWDHHGIIVPAALAREGPGMVRPLDRWGEPQAWCPQGFEWVKYGKYWRCKPQH